MNNQTTYTTILFTIVLLSAGTTANTTQQDNTQDKFNSTPLTQNTTKYVSKSENTNITLIMNETNETYNLTWKTRTNFSKNNSNLDRKEKIQLTAETQCRIVQDLSYNYEKLKNQITRLQNLETGKTNKTPIEKFKNYRPKHIEGTIHNKNSSKKVAFCNPTKENINVKRRIT